MTEKKVRIIVRPYHRTPVSKFECDKIPIDILSKVDAGMLIVFSAGKAWRKVVRTLSKNTKDKYKAVVLSDDDILRVQQYIRDGGCVEQKI